MSETIKARQHVYAHILNRNGIEVGFQTCDGGLIDLVTNGFSDPQGFYITLAPGATEGLLSVKPWQSDEYKLLPFFLGRNSVLVKAVRVDVGNTATLAYWEK
jgi:hypothetical protein